MLNLFKKNKKSAERYSHTDYNIIFDNDTVEDTPIELITIGDLNIPTGKIVACDPLACPDMTPFEKMIPPGKYPVKIYIAKTKDSGDRFAMAKLEINSKKADKWVLAIHDGDDISKLEKASDFYGFPVDAGVGGFFDYKTSIEYNKFIDTFYKNNPDGNVYDDFFAKEFKKSAKDPSNPNDIGEWVNFTLPHTDLNVSMFHSGYGDGVYPSFWGMTFDNEIVSLVIDFFVLLLPDGNLENTDR